MTRYNDLVGIAPFLCNRQEWCLRFKLWRSEKLPHGWSCGGIPGQARHAAAFGRQAKDGLMLLESDGLVAAPGERTDDGGGNVPPASSEICKVRFIKDDDE